MDLPAQLLDHYYGNATLAAQWIERNGFAHWEQMQSHSQQRLAEPRELPILCLPAVKLIMNRHLKPLLIPQGGEILYDPLCDLLNLFASHEELHPILLHIKSARGSITQPAATQPSVSRLILMTLSSSECDGLLEPNQVHELMEWWQHCSAQQQALLHRQAGVPLSSGSVRNWLESTCLFTLVASLTDVRLDSRIHLRWQQHRLFRDIVASVRHTDHCTLATIERVCEQSERPLPAHGLFDDPAQRGGDVRDLLQLEHAFRLLLREQIRGLQAREPAFWTARPLNIMLRNTQLARTLRAHRSFILLEDSTVTGETWLCCALLLRAFCVDSQLVFMPFRDREFAKGHDTQTIAQIAWQSTLALEEDHQAYSRFLPNGMARHLWMHKTSTVIPQALDTRAMTAMEQQLIALLDRRDIDTLAYAGISPHLALHALLRGTSSITWAYLKEIAIAGQGYRDTAKYRTVLNAITHLGRQIETQQLAALQQASLALQPHEELHICTLWEARRVRLRALEQMTIDVIRKNFPLVQRYLHDATFDETSLFMHLYAQITHIECNISRE